MNEKKVIEAKARLFELMKPFIDENKCINLSGFRKACPQKYAILPHYFGSVDKALAELNLIKVTFVPQKASPKGLSLRDKLALDMLDHLRFTEKDSFESIATHYGVTKPLVAQLHKALRIAAEKVAFDEMEIEENVNG